MKIKSIKTIVAPYEGYLRHRFDGYFAQISTDTMLRLKSSVKDVARVLDGKVSPEIEKLVARMQVSPQGIADRDFIFGYVGADGQPVPGSIETDEALKEYTRRYPKHWEVAQKAIGLQRQKSIHACGVVLSDEPIVNFIPTTTVGSSALPVTQYTPSGVEAVGGIKLDFLGVSCLKDIQGCIRLIQQRQGYTQKDEQIDGLRVPGLRVIPHCGALLDVWDLPEDQAVFRDICEGKTETVFQFSTPAAKQWLKLFFVNGKHTLTSVAHLSAFTALDRPGPLDATVTDGVVSRNMLAEFASRASGAKPIGNNPHLDRLLPDTYGVIVYQESLQQIFQEIGQTTPEAGDLFRQHIGKKKMAEVAKDRDIFLPGAIKTLGSVEEAERIWGQMFTFGQYGFNKSHSAAYAYTGYVCAWLKHYYSLEWWCAVLRNADRNEIDDSFWVHAGHLIDSPDVRLSGDDFEIQNERIRAPLRLLVGVGPTAHEELIARRPYTDLRDFLQKIKVKKETLVNGHKGRSALGRSLITKLIVSGCADSLFPVGCNDVYTKLTFYETTDAEVNDRRYKRTGELKIHKADERFLNLTPIQRYLLTKSILPSYTQPLAQLVAAMGRVDYKTQGNKYAWHAPEKFEGQNWTVLVPGKAVRALLTNSIGGIPPKFKFGCVAYVSEAVSFWGGKATKVSFEVDGERFRANLWPRTTRKPDGDTVKTPIKLPEGTIGGVCVLTLRRWDIEKDFTLDDICVITPAVVIKESSEQIDDK